MRRKNAPQLLFDVIDNESLSVAAVTQIEDLILSGVLRENDMLPGERELSEQFGISRPKVREALSQLAETGLVRIVPNDGIYVSKLGGDVMSPALISLYNRSSSAIRDNLEYRREQEGFACRLAAHRATNRDQLELKRVLQDMEAADAAHDAEKAADLDLTLHHCIVFAAHNSTLTHMMAALYNLNRSSIFFNRAKLLNVEKTSGVLFGQHSDIVEAICQGNPHQAEKAAHTHIDYVCALIETEFEKRSREALSKKRFSRLD